MKRISRRKIESGLPGGPGLRSESRRRRGTLLCALALWVLFALALSMPAAAQEDTDTPTSEARPTVDAGDESAPPAGDLVVETVNVTAEAIGDRFSPESVSSAVVEIDDTIGASTAVEAARVLPGVAENGQAGIFQVLSVRGVSRQRLLSFIDGMRISSERRAGVSVSFVDPSLLGQIEVSRGPASTYYGSGALGGAVQLFSRRAQRLEAEAGWQSQGDETYQRLAWGRLSGGQMMSGAIAHRRANDAETAAGDRLFSRYEQTSGNLRFDVERGGLDHDVSILGSYGEDIGKANNQFPSRTTIYPRERHGLARYQVDAQNRWRLRLWTHDQDLVTDSRRDGGQRNLVENSSTDFGGLFEHRIPTDSTGWDGRFGVQTYNRRNVSSDEVQNLGSASDSFRSLDDAREDEIAGFAVVNWEWRDARFEAGGRYTEGRQRPGSGLERRTRTAFTGFVGAAVPIGTRLQLVGTLGRGLRFPSLTEQFFTGTTGRGQVVGNPNLGEETSTNVEAALKFLGRRGAWSVSAFRNEIDDYIERVELEPDVRSFVNLTSGRILGVELEGFTALGGASSPWRLDASAHWIDGESEAGDPLADIPADRVRAALSWTEARWTVRGALAWRAEKSDFGPSERSTPSAWVLDGAVDYRISDAWSVRLNLENGLDEEYLPAADDEAPAAPGRGIGVSLRFGR